MSQQALSPLPTPLYIVTSKLTYTEFRAKCPEIFAQTRFLFCGHTVSTGTRMFVIFSLPV
ncbi:hypothetical protein BgiBS90_010465, partial [Biomphalaria glabrata]